ncbi:hypothetical protein G7Y89_g9566 [Cudoniella acicularis]|uniref:TLDc domain-containing protein n=1 Tax=Cudoniella acicularis TaxID=354080 RepID=A0A8H4RH73_9HELO|nr:hypothetical protein G7Y89_g9566 [Cudoniella acicularis]
MANEGIGIEQGIMAKEPIIERVDDSVRLTYAMWPEEEALLAQIFDKGAILTKTAFISLLATKGALPRSSEGVEAGEIIYTSMVYLATLPFPHYPEGPDAQPPDGLSSNQLMRGLVWANTDRVKYIIEQNSDDERAESDYLRRIFQSLASVRSSENASDITRDSPDENKTYSSDPDSDSDEMYQDLLAVVHSTQVVRQYGGHLRVNLRRDRFRTICKSLRKEYKVPSLHEFVIPIQRFTALVRCLLLLQFEPIEPVVDLSRFDSAARSVCASFLQNPNDRVITWPTFEYAVRNIAPYLLDAYYRLLTQTFCGRSSPFGVLDAAEVPSSVSAPAGIALTLPLQCQLVTFLNNSIAFDLFTRIRHYSASNLPTPTALLSTMQAMPDEALVVLFGKMATGESCTFGLFSPTPKSDGLSIQIFKPSPSHDGFERCSIFQLAPVQDLYRGIVGKPGWIVDDKRVTFGQGGGVILDLKDNLAQAQVRHQISEGDEIESTYKANPFRGNWVIDFEIIEVEIWSDVV